MNKDSNTLLIDYLDGNLSLEEHQDLKTKIAQSPELQKELEALKTILSETEHLLLNSPKMAMRERFYDFLEEQIERQIENGRTSKLRTVNWTAAAALALLVVGLAWLWHRNQLQATQIIQLEEQMKNTQQMLMLSMLQNSSASDRIQALNAVQTSLETTKSQVMDEKIIEALIHTMNYDENLNVQMKAAESLGNFIGEPKVSRAFIESLSIQESPEIQIIIIDLLTAAKAQEATLEFQNLLSREKNTRSG